MGHLMPSALRNLQRQSQLRSCGNVLLTYLFPFSIFTEWAIDFQPVSKRGLSVWSSEKGASETPEAPSVYWCGWHWFLMVPPMFLWYFLWRVSLLPCGKLIPSEGGWGKLKENSIIHCCASPSSHKGPQHPEGQKQRWVYQIIAGHSSPKASFGTSQPRLMRVWQLCQMCLPFVFHSSWKPSIPKLTHAKGACRRDKLLERGTRRFGNGRAPGHCSNISSACAELHLLFTGFTDVQTDVVKGSCAWDLLGLAGGSKVLESWQQVM